jgi:hypothetical protein
MGIKYLNIKPGIIKCQEENIQKKASWHWLWQWFLDMTPRPHTTIVYLSPNSPTYIH